jgi:hypothetical protein
LSLRRPELELGITGGAQFDEIFLAAVVHLDGSDDL